MGCGPSQRSHFSLGMVAGLQTGKAQAWGRQDETAVLSAGLDRGCRTPRGVTRTSGFQNGPALLLDWLNCCPW